MQQNTNTNLMMGGNTNTNTNMSGNNTNNRGLITIIGASGNVGSGTIKELCELNRGHRIRACCRNPGLEKMKSIAALPNVDVVRGSAGDPASLDAALSGAESCFIVTPNDIDRTRLTKNCIDACVRAKIRHMVLISVPSVDKPDELLGGQFKPIEEHAKASGVPFTILRCALFMDNLLMHRQTIKGQGKLMKPMSPSAKGSFVAISDVCACAAMILADGPAKHGQKIYTLACAAPVSAAECAAALSHSLGRNVECVQVPDEKAAQLLTELGAPEWTAKAVVELERRIANGNFVWNSDVKTIIGRDPINMQQWAHRYAVAFN